MMHSRDSLLEWAMPCGTWFGHRVRASVLFLVVPIILGIQVWDFRLAVIFGLFLAIAVLIHEIALLFAIRISGGEVREMLMWPLGGVPRMAGSGLSPAPVASVIAALVSAAVSVLCLPSLLARGSDWSFLNPMVLPVHEIAGNIEFDLLSLFFFVNWIVLLVNLLPAQPLDGGRVLDSVVVNRVGAIVGRQVVARIGMAVGVGVILSALLLENVWFCAIGAVLVGYNLREAMRLQVAESFDDSFMGYDFSQGYTSLERSTMQGDETPRSPGLFHKWTERRRQRRAERQRAKAEQADRQLDSLLEKVHTYGIDSLTDAERRTLRRVSARYRGRTDGT